ncbi:MAG: bifunctional helix-turn-helix transcriptional regulator/GNAT family N-acetyltransferase [Xanthomonadales bacterium]|nr:bifunctional helix-turn-helix transcriptional regulator/GNAT family N-acetyltransferase [Xanthomonadales bacterium]
MEPVRETRAATRSLVRGLKILGGPGEEVDLAFSECHVLVELGERGASTVSELSDLLVLEKSTVSRLVGGLVDKGLLSSRRSPRDGRQRVLELTDDGQAKVAEIHRAADRQVGSAFEFLTAAEQETIRESLARYAKALRYARLAEQFRIRPIQPADNPAMAGIIRSVMTEFGAVGSGFSIEDPEVNRMYETYQADRAAYWVIESSGEVLGGGGIAALKGGDPDVCELQKMYFHPRLRGCGLGVPLIKRCLAAAREFGYAACYLETLDHMHQARRLYRRMGFEDLDAPCGATGHYKCNSWMMLRLRA